MNNATKYQHFFDTGCMIFLKEKEQIRCACSNRGLSKCSYHQSQYPVTAAQVG